MNFPKGIIAVILALALGLSSTTHLTSCTKEVVRDTTVIIERDTIIKEITDTIIQVDTICKLELGLVAHYNFTNGSLLDETKYHNDIVFSNAIPTEDIKENPDNAYLFDGSTSFMKVPNSASLNPQNITLMARVKVNDFYMGVCHHNDIISKGATDITEGFYVLRFTDPFGRCHETPDVSKEFFVGSYGDNVPQGSATGVLADTTFISKQEWYTVVFTYDGTTSKLYVDGKLQAENQKTVSFTPNSGDLFIGRHEDPSFPYWFNGVIDEIRIYDRAVNCYEAAMLSIPTSYVK